MRTPKLPHKVKIRSRDGDYIDIPAIKAFDMFGEAFYAHPSISYSGCWSITHAGTGAAIIPSCDYKTKSKAINAAKERLALFGEEKFFNAVKLAKGKS